MIKPVRDFLISDPSIATNRVKPATAITIIARSLKNTEAGRVSSAKAIHLSLSPRDAAALLIQLQGLVAAGLLVPLAEQLQVTDVPPAKNRN